MTTPEPWDAATRQASLEALQLAEATIERLNRHNSANGTLDVVRAAIAKAETYSRG